MYSWCDYPGCNNFYLDDYSLSITPTKINFELPLLFCDEHYNSVIQQIQSGECIFCDNKANYGFRHDGNLLFCGYHAGDYSNKTGFKLEWIRNIKCVDHSCKNMIARYSWPGNTNPRYCMLHYDESMSKLF